MSPDPAPLAVVEEGGVRALEGVPGKPFLAVPEDSSRLIEACFSHDVDAALLYPENLTPAFFDLSSGEAGAVLQKVLNYRMRLVVVCPPGAVRLSRRFGEVVAEERRGRHFALVPTREEAWEWLQRTAARPESG